MQKISSQKIAQVVKSAKEAIVSLAAERNKLASEVAELRRLRDVEKLASDMHERGARMDVTHPELVDELLKAANDGRLDVIKEALDLYPTLGYTDRISDSNSNTGDNFTNYLLGNVG